MNIFYMLGLWSQEKYCFLLDVLNEMKKNGAVVKLVLAGRPGWGKDEVKSKVSKLGLESNVIFTGYVTKKELIALYSYASALLFQVNTRGLDCQL